MAVVVNPGGRVEQWRSEIALQMPAEDVCLLSEVDDLTKVDFLVAWSMTLDELMTMPNLQAVLCTGAGTEQWQKPGIEVPIVRLADPEMANEMAAYALAWVIRHQRGFGEAEKSQRAGKWEAPGYTQPYEYHVGVLGYGEIGARIGRAFADLGYQVNAWTRSGRDDATVCHFAGLDQLGDFIASSDVVINVLPSTEATTGLLTAERFAQFRQGALFVNIGRGTVVADEAELAAALDSGPLAAAVLDVTSPEPPIEGSPLYTHAAVTLTAHLSGATQVRSAAKLIAANIARMRAGEAAFPLLDRARGY